MRHSNDRSIGRWVRVLVTSGLGLALSATLLAACSSTPKATSNGASAPGVTSSTITLGATVPLTGPAAPGYDEIAPAMDAVFAWVNAHGGVNGRQIHYTYLDDGYNPANTATLTRKLVLQDNVFADVGSLGTPTQAAVQGFLNSQKVPQLFIESGCNCWSDPTYPYSSGWQPPYTVEGKILGKYVKDNFAGKKIGYLYQGDEFGQDVVKGLDMEIPSASVVSRQTYDASTLAGPLSNQMAALKAAGAQVVVMATIPAATALAMLPGVAIGYLPQYVLSNVGADPPTVGPLLSSFTQKGGGTAAQAKAAAGLLNGVITDAYFAPENDVSNPWVQVEKKLLADYRAQPVCQVRVGRQHSVRRGAGLHGGPGPAGGGKEPDPGRAAGGHRQIGKDIRHPRFRAPVLLEQRALRVPRSRDHQAQQHRPAGGDAHRELDRRHPGHSGRGDRRRIGSGDDLHRQDLDTTEEPGVDLVVNRLWQRATEDRRC